MTPIEIVTDPRATRAGRMKQPIALGVMVAGAAAVAVVSLPVGLLELAITSAGLSELFPAAAPPLGWTARAVLAGFAGVMGFGIGLAAARVDAVEGEEEMGFAFSKLASLAGLRRRVRNPEMPVIRRADAHPDAPPRKPIFASSDFEAPDFFTPAVMPPSGVERPFAPVALGAPLCGHDDFADLPEQEIEARYLAEAFHDEEVIGEGEWSDEAGPVDHDIAEPLPAPPLETPSPLHALSVAELARRLETALARRDAAGQPMAPPIPSLLDRSPVLADIPPAAPVPVKPAVDAEEDKALRQALGALKMGR